MGIINFFFIEDGYFRKFLILVAIDYMAIFENQKKKQNNCYYRLIMTLDFSLSTLNALWG